MLHRPLRRTSFDLAMMTHPFLDSLRPTLHISHRGGSLLAPENTLLAFEQALRRFRTDLLELDVHRTKDGELVVTHDATLERCTDGRGLLRDHTLAELQTLDAGFHFSPDGGATHPFRGTGVRIPTLRELLRAYPQTRLNIEVKPNEPGIEDAFAEVLHAENAVLRVCCGSEQDAVASRLVEALPEACHFYPRDALVALVMALKMGEPVPLEPRFQVLDMPATFQGLPLLDAAFLARTRELGKWVNVWTVDDPGQMRALVALQVGGIMTDRPDLLRDVLDAPLG